MAAGGTANGYKNFNSGLGFLLTYDSRDIPANAYKGVYLDFRGMMYSKAFGSDNNFYRLELDYRQQVRRPPQGIRLDRAKQERIRQRPPHPVFADRYPFRPARLLHGTIS